MSDEWYEFPPVEYSYHIAITGGFEVAVVASSGRNSDLKKLPQWVTWMPTTDNIEIPQV